MAEEMKKLGLPPPEFSEPTEFRVLVVLRNDLERRRQRQGAPAFREKWGEVLTLIEEPELSLYRWRGIEQWDALERAGASPPQEVLVSAAKALMKPGLPEDQRTKLTEQLFPFTVSLPKPELDALLSAFTQGQFATTPTLEQRIVMLFRISRQTWSSVLQWLETCPPATPDVGLVPNQQINVALQELDVSLRGGAVPARDHVNRVLSIARRHAALPAAQQFFQYVTGQPLK